ncbi:tripartite motif-containing protein 16-like protein isoform X2 [Oreochromis niloticus]|uniref:tripartite motif-containing protein 16-like protein isoform X2 n=1 Tax=Oreochromis niloticus TaxID=8128 RepID=UPI000DF1B682|nr:tripartite motif-containing protein 16-like protein isoform X2 [Oreochromis niloticus]
MAQANISVTESQFRCPICLDILKDPVSIPCGHTYCMACINSYWDRVDSGQFSCPQCRDTFSPRPVLRRNTVLAEVLGKLKLNEIDTAPEVYLGGVGEVPCDFCTAESKLRADKSCLVCLASFCKLHVLPHREVGTLRRHKLVPAVECVAEKLCAQHRLGLEPEGSGSEAGGAVEWSGYCLLCQADQEEARSVEAQRARRQLQLQESQRMVQGRIRTGETELQEFQQTLESLKVSASAVLEDSEALFADMALCLEKTKAEARARLEAKERAIVARAESDIELLEKDLEELRRRDEEISQLLQSEDNAHFLQVPDQRMRAAFLRFSCHLTFDPDTAHPTLVLLEGPQGAHCGEEPQPYQPHPQRFDSVAQVLCREGQFGGASYWEVEWRGGGWIDIGVTYRGIGRKGGGKPCLLGRNEHSWRLRCSHAGYAAWHDNRKTTVAAPPSPRIGVFLERQKGDLSFYSISDSMVLLHTFHCSFSQPLYPAFRLDLDSTLLICPHEGS